LKCSRNATKQNNGESPISLICQASAATLKRFPFDGGVAKTMPEIIVMRYFNVRPGLVIVITGYL
jgi:hypothetical protein